MRGKARREVHQQWWTLPRNIKQVWVRRCRMGKWGHLRLLWGGIVKNVCLITAVCFIIASADAFLGCLWSVVGGNWQCCGRRGSLSSNVYCSVSQFCLTASLGSQSTVLQSFMEPESLHSCPSPDAKSSACLYTGAKSNLRESFGWSRKEQLYRHAKEDTVGSCLKKLCVPTQEDLMKSFIAIVQGWCCEFQMVGLLILMPFSCPFNLASSGLAAPLLISNCLNLPFGTWGMSWRLVLPTGNGGQ